MRPNAILVEERFNDHNFVWRVYNQNTEELIDTYYMEKGSDGWHVINAAMGIYLTKDALLKMVENRLRIKYNITDRRVPESV